jgi:hypothetical protein
VNSTINGNFPLNTAPQFDALIAIYYLMQDKFGQCSVVGATLENNTTFANI